jgi:serine/threonine protein kinase
MSLPTWTVDTDNHAPVIPDGGLAPGVLVGPWCIEYELGHGGMGTVYAVVHEAIGKRAAMKVVHRHVLGRATSADRFLEEARIVNAVAHPGIVDIFETGTLADGRPYLVMERLLGRTLAERAHDGKVLADEAIDLLLGVCDAVAAAHAVDVVHRDLKLDNVFLVDSPDGPPRAKLLDWGIAKVVTSEATATYCDQLIGTPRYVSPEQARGAAVTFASDIYSLGVMAYELLLEGPPFVAPSVPELLVMHLRDAPPLPRGLWPDIPIRLELLLLRMLAKEPGDRPRIHDVIRELKLVRDELDQRCGREARTSRPITASRAVAPVESVDMPSPWLARVPNRSWVIAVASVVGLFIGAFGMASLPEGDAAVPGKPSDVFSTTTTKTTPAAATPAASKDNHFAVALEAAATLDGIRLDLRDRTISRPPTKKLRKSQGGHARKPSRGRGVSRIDPDGTLEPYK